MAPKRPAPPASSSAFPNGTAFRKSASKKRKGESSKVIPKTTESPKQSNGKGKGKAKEQGSSGREVGTRSTRTASVPSKTSKDGNKKTATVQIAPSKDATAPKPKAKPLGKELASVQPGNKEIGPLKSFRIVVGSYERLLYGYHVTFKDENDSLTPTFETMFSFAAHTSCISAIAAAGSDSKWLATGAGDETVRVWDLKKKKEVGGLIGHSGTIHSLSFPARTYLLSADSSGLINLYRTRDWSLLKTLRGHTGQINACVAHPSGKLALSVGKDGMLRMWDLMRGKGAGAVRLNLGQEEGSKTTFKEEPLDVTWNLSGSRFAVMGRTEVVVYKTDMSRLAGLLVRRDDPKRRFGCVEWQGDDILLTGNEMGVVEVYRLSDSSIQGPICKLTGHTNRVRDVRTIALQLEDKRDTVIVTTASSDGKVRLYDISSVTNAERKDEEAIELQPIGMHDTGGARLTCLDVVGGSGGSTTQKSVVDDGDDEDAEEESDEEVDGSELDQAEIEELYDLLDLVEEAKKQGIEVDGLSEFEASAGDDDDDDDVYGDSDLEGLEDDDDEGQSDDEGEDGIVEGEEELESEEEVEEESE